MTITISPLTEAMLKEQAVRLGQDTDTFADTLLQDVLSEAARDFEESCAAVAEALAGDPADDISLHDYKAQFESDRAARRSRQAPRAKQDAA